jgi:hypothetical protein
LNQDGFLSPIDALFVINHLNDAASAASDDGIRFDLNDDGEISPADALVVINAINDSPSGWLPSDVDCIFEQSGALAIEPTIHPGTLDAAAQAQVLGSEDTEQPNVTIAYPLSHQNVTWTSSFTTTDPQGTLIAGGTWQNGPSGQMGELGWSLDVPPNSRVVAASITIDPHPGETLWATYGKGGHGRPGSVWEARLNSEPVYQWINDTAGPWDSWPEDCPPIERLCDTGIIDLSQDHFIHGDEIQFSLFVHPGAVLDVSIATVELVLAPLPPAQSVMDGLQRALESARLLRDSQARRGVDRELAALSSEFDTPATRAFGAIIPVLSTVASDPWLLEHAFRPYLSSSISPDAAIGLVVADAVGRADLLLDLAQTDGLDRQSAAAALGRYVIDHVIADTAIGSEGAFSLAEGIEWVVGRGGHNSTPPADDAQFYQAATELSLNGIPLTFNELFDLDEATTNGPVSLLGGDLVSAGDVSITIGGDAVAIQGDWCYLGCSAQGNCRRNAFGRCGPVRGRYACHAAIDVHHGRCLDSIQQ